MGRTRLLPLCRCIHLHIKKVTIATVIVPVITTAIRIAFGLLSPAKPGDREEQLHFIHDQSVFCKPKTELVNAHVGLTRTCTEVP